MLYETQLKWNLNLALWDHFEKFSALELVSSSERESTTLNIFVILSYRVVRIVLNGVLYLSVWSVINVNGSIISCEAWEDGGPNRSQLKEKKSKENILCFSDHSQLTVSQLALWSCQVSIIPSPSISSYPACFLVLSGNRAPLWWQRLACCSKLYSTSERGTWWTRPRRKKAFASTLSASWLLRPS